MSSLVSHNCCLLCHLQLRLFLLMLARLHKHVVWGCIEERYAQLAGGKLLLSIAGARIENPHERLFIEAGYLLSNRSNIGDFVALWHAVLGDNGTRSIAV